MSVGRLPYINTRAADEARERGTATLSPGSGFKKANEVHSFTPTQEHPRECRCTRPLFLVGEDACVKCGLPTVFEPASPVVMLQAAEACRVEHETMVRKRYKEIHGR